MEPQTEIAALLFLDESTIAEHLYEWLEKEKLALESGGSEPKLSKPQMNALAAELEKNPYPTVLSISAWIQKKWGIWYTVPGLASLDGN